ncbi:hypothetical protein [Cypionkella sp.]|uniref:hypothetical protein n=1 Tax=Cypionkella sp. TaxID=2811411 RepID=UPI002ABB79EA|nr:hypothetical protein [Cypionkella sp.]MDZ4393802.1 hypothetical protein [Cypionkella sp.]
MGHDTQRGIARPGVTLRGGEAREELRVTAAGREVGGGPQADAIKCGAGWQARTSLLIARDRSVDQARNGSPSRALKLVPRTGEKWENRMVCRESLPRWAVSPIQYYDPPAEIAHNCASASKVSIRNRWLRQRAITPLPRIAIFGKKERKMAMIRHPVTGLFMNKIKLHRGAVSAKQRQTAQLLLAEGHPHWLVAAMLGCHPQSFKSNALPPADNRRLIGRRLNAPAVRRDISRPDRVGR